MGNEFSKIEELNGLCPFKMLYDLNNFEKEFMPLMKYYGVEDEQKQRNLISSIWLFANDQWRAGQNYEKNEQQIKQEEVLG